MILHEAALDLRLLHSVIILSQDVWSDIQLVVTAHINGSPEGQLGKVGQWW